MLQYSQQYGYRIRLWVDGKRELTKDEYTSWHNSAIKAWDHGANPILTRWGLLWRPWRAMGG